MGDCLSYLTCNQRTMDNLPGDKLLGDNLSCDNIPGDNIPGDNLPGDNQQRDTTDTNNSTGNTSRLSVEVDDPAMSPNTVDRMADTDVDDPDEYDFTHKQRGYMLLVVNDTLNRKGAEEDEINAIEIAKKLEFSIIIEKNLSKSEMISVLQNARTKLEHSDSDCFALVISTHGENTYDRGKWEHALKCSDGKKIFTSDIFDMFKDRQCPTLKDKPKLFFIQACRGNQLDDGAYVYVADPGKAEDKTRGAHRGSDAGPNFQTGIQVSDGSETAAPAAPAAEPIIADIDNDFLVMYAIPPGMFAWRHEREGSWMIMYLHTVIMAYNMEPPIDLLTLLTSVSAKMSRRETNTKYSSTTDKKKAVSVIEHKLTKDVIFTPK